MLEDVIGEGEFGRVMSARAMDKKVAVKMLKSNHTKEEVHDLLTEFR